MEHDLYSSLIRLVNRTEQQISKNLEIANLRDNEGDLAEILETNAKRFIDDFEKEFISIINSSILPKDVLKDCSYFIEIFKESMESIGNFKSLFIVASSEIKPVKSTIQSYRPITGTLSR